MIIEKVISLKQSHIKQYPVNANSASNLGHPCVRYLVLLRTRWQEKPLHNVDLQFIFDEGKLHETAVLKELTEAGHQVIEQQRAFSWPEYQITGHIDAKVALNGEVYPIEIKSASNFSFQKINSISDMFSSNYLYMRKYPDQLTLYLLMDNKEQGFFIFKNKQTGQLKEIPLTLDYDRGETLIKRAEAINLHIAQSTPLPEIEAVDYSEDVCGQCDFIHICLPEVKRGALEFSNDTALMELLTEWDSLKASAKRFEQLDKTVKTKVKEVEKAVCGEFLITGKMLQRKAYTVEETEYWQSKIQKLGGGEKSGE